VLVRFYHVASRIVNAGYSIIVKAFLNASRLLRQHPFEVASHDSTWRANPDDVLRKACKIWIHAADWAEDHVEKR
jgi:hypothetical protein